MKKGNIRILAILTGVSLVLMTGCGNKAQEAAGVETQTEIKVEAVTEQATVESIQTETTASETLDYAYCLHITINPEFKLYLDEQSKILAVDCINQDAENLLSGTDLKGKDLEEAMPVIIQRAVEQDYLTDGKNITIDVEKSQDPEQADYVEQVIATVVTEALKKQNVNAVLQLQDAGTPMETPVAWDKNGNVTESGETSNVPENGNTENEETISVSQKTKCTACGGTGICQECQGGTAPCKRCGGTLWETCGTCGGSGRQTCPGCGGSGVDATDGSACRHCGGSGGNTCQQCGGSGGKPCSICQGKGVISDDCILCHGDKRCTVCGGSGEL